MAGRSSSSLPSSSKSQASSRLARSFTKGDVGKALGPIETREISQNMLSVVWIIDVGYTEQNADEPLGVQGTGFCVHPDGYILTAAHLFPETMTDIHIRKIDDSYFRSSREGNVKLIQKFDSFDIAVVKVEFSRKGDENGFHYANFGDGDLFRGQEVIIIGHPMKWVYTSVRGEICFPCVNNVTVSNAPTVTEVDVNVELCTAWSETPTYRKVADVVDRFNPNMASFGIDVPLIQINNVHGATGSSGSPVFNVTGHVIGMVIFVEASVDFAVNVCVLRELFETALKHDNKKERKKRKEKIERKQRDESKGKRKLAWYRHV